MVGVGVWLRSSWCSRSVGVLEDCTACRSRIDLSSRLIETIADGHISVSGHLTDSRIVQHRILCDSVTEYNG